jgi:hypothetical protein
MTAGLPVKQQAFCLLFSATSVVFPCSVRSAPYEHPYGAGISEVKNIYIVNNTVTGTVPLPPDYPHTSNPAVIT